MKPDSTGTTGPATCPSLATFSKRRAITPTIAAGPWRPSDWRRCGRSRNPVGNEFNTRILIPGEGAAISAREYAGCLNDFLADRADDAPFFFWCGCHEPYRSYTPGQGVQHDERLEAITEIPACWLQDDTFRHDLLDDAVETECFDRQVGNLPQTLEAMDKLHNTLVVCNSDNGAPFLRVKVQMFDDDFRLPLCAT